MSAYLKMLLILGSNADPRAEAVTKAVSMKETYLEDLAAPVMQMSFAIRGTEKGKMIEESSLVEETTGEDSPVVEVIGEEDSVVEEMIREDSVVDEMIGEEDLVEEDVTEGPVSH